VANKSLIGILENLNWSSCNLKTDLEGNGRALNLPGGPEVRTYRVLTMMWPNTSIREPHFLYSK
jgi:hypothetical protein